MKFNDFLERSFHFLRYDIWRNTVDEMTSSRRIGYKTIRTLVLAVRGYINDKLAVRASALTYSILFATVPILALMVGVARGFGFESIIKEALNDSFVGQANMVDTVMEFVQRYLETASGGVFVGVGIIALAWAIISFFLDLQQAFNDIWQVSSSSSYIRQFVTYIAILLLMPVLIITSTGLRIYFGNTDAGSLFIKGISPLIQFFLLLTPYIVSWIMFLVLYMALPNTKVKFVNAGIAALFTSVFFNIFQQIYIWGQVFLNRYNVVYGSFAAVPLLLMFIQISCIIMLLGAEIAYASQNVANFDYETDTDNISPHYKHFLTLYVVRCIIKRFEHGQSPMSAEQIALENHLPIRLTMQILKDMVNAKVLIEVFADPTTGKSYQPARDINTLSIRTITSMRMHYGTENFINNPPEEMKRFKKNYDKFLEQNKEHDILIKDL